MVAKYLEHEINEQAKTLEDLQKLGASDATVSAEMKKLNELQNIASKNFRQDLVEKIRRQKSKASQFKEKFGLGSGSAVGGGGGSSATAAAAAAAAKLAKSKSVCVPSPTVEELPDLSRDFNNAFLGKKSAMKTGQSLGEEEQGEERLAAAQRPFLTSQHSTIDEEEDIIDEVMDRADEGPAEAVYTSVR